MGDDKKDKKVSAGVQLALGIFIVFSILNHLYSGAAFYVTLLTLAAFLSVFLVLKGIWDYFVHGDLDHFWSGSAIALILVLFFNGLSLVLGAFGVVMGFFNILLGAVV